MEDSKTLYEFIKDRLPDIEGYGNTGKEFNEDNIPNHSVYQQSLRENYEGDVGIFETNISDYSIMGGQVGYISEVQIALVCVKGDIDGGVSYLKATLENIKKNSKSIGVYVKDSKLINLLPLGKNSSGLHMISMNMLIKYALLN